MITESHAHAAMHALRKKFGINHRSTKIIVQCSDYINPALPSLTVCPSGTVYKVVKIEFGDIPAWYMHHAWVPKTIPLFVWDP